MGTRNRRVLAMTALACGITAVAAPTAGANPPSAPPALSSGSAAPALPPLPGGLTEGALTAAFDAGLPVVEATGTQKPPWYSNPTVFYRVVTDRGALASPSAKFVVWGQRPPDSFGALPTGVAGPIATWDPRGTDPNVQWSFATTPTLCAATCAGVAYFSFAR
ncbi:hypothetical protein [Rhodococcus sp. NPDC059234]|uniref:hypothetical protein n=1 Tax=Rhodococcus sp. NPDC059234 TaxID=3346781 RepID=UPI00366F85D5